MNIGDLDKKLREMSPSEKKLRKLSKYKKDKNYSKRLEGYFSNETGDNSWVINNSKLMKKSEDISIHKHDRFTRFDKHKHDYLELVFVYSGSIRQIVDDKSIEMKKGEILIMDMNVEHSIEESVENDIAINVLIKKEFFDWVFMNQIADNDLMSNFIVKSLYEKDKFKRFLYFKTSDNKKVWDFMINILMEYYDNKTGMKTAIRAYMILLFNELLRDYNRYLPNNIIYKIDSSATVEIMKYIGNDYRNIVLKDLAEHFNYSTDYMGKLVKKITGKTFNELRRNIRMRRAKYLLKNSNMSISDVISRVGYSNLSYFYKQFREDTGITPDEYRKI
ncbi:AraC family transcriptional regulator [uncultured Clostridium sp.]|uniref:AraC family transcriptional regulator n=1 Tax=uncultured Clostridium sp. TaxID=59620 RepID=UPI0025DB369A|nr:AraC family transcriptional regulator [uncultured Clostridium sp.]